MFAVKALIAAPTSFDLKKFERDLTELEEKVGVEVLPPAPAVLVSTSTLSPVACGRAAMAAAWIRCGRNVADCR
jgi:hypothetical protein